MVCLMWGQLIHFSQVTLKVFRLLLVFIKNKRSNLLLKKSNFLVDPNRLIGDLVPSPESSSSMVLEDISHGRKSSEVAFK